MRTRCVVPISVRRGVPRFALLVACVACSEEERVDLVASPAGLPTTPAVEVGMSEAGLARIRPAMQAYVDDGRLAGVMTMVARNGHVVHWEAVGARDLDAADPLEPDDLFRIYSMTKPITSVAVMILIEEGRLSLDDPLSEFIPAFADVKVLTEAGEHVPPARPITIEHLLTHTSGLTYGFFGDTPVDSLYLASGFFFAATGLEDFAARAADLPLLASPGSRWNYSVSTDMLGRVVEVASGQPFDVFVTERILAPLQMDDTGFWVPPEKRSRFMADYVLDGGSLVTSDSPTDGTYTHAPAWLSGGGGLVSTASDYIRFAQMLLNGGQLGDVNILRPETVQMMTSSRLPGSLVPIDLAGLVPPVYGFGLGVAVLVDEGGTQARDNDGSYWWAGASNTYFWIDPEAQLIAMVWTQVQPFAVYPIDSEFLTLVYEAIQ